MRLVLAAVLASFVGFLALSATARAELVAHLPGPQISVPDGGRLDGIAVGPGGTIYAGLTRASRASIVALDPDGRLLREWPFDGLTTTRGDLVLAVGPDGNVYAAQHVGFAAGAEAVRVFRPDGALLREFGAGAGLTEVTDIELDAAGNVYLTSRARPGLGLPDDTVVRFDAAGNLSGRFAPDPGNPGPFANALPGLAVADDGTVWVATSNPRRPLVRIAPDGATTPAFNSWSILPGNDDDVEDVEYFAGRLYFSGFLGNSRRGELIAMVVTTTTGVRLDLVAGQARKIAATGDRVYLAGLSARGPALTAAGDGIGSVRTFVVTSGAPTTSGGALCPGGIVGTGLGGTITVIGSGDCRVQFHNHRSPWPDDACVAVAAYHAGQRIHDPQPVASGGYTVRVGTHSGSVHVEWRCTLDDGSSETRVEFKGEVELIDPSGVVLDARSGRPVRSAEVRLEVAPARGARFGRPSLAAISPQVNPQRTDSAGRFGWDVAPGLWRLRIRAFGYRPYTSPTYVIPPEVTGLRLRLRPHPAQQAVLIDYVTGRVGRVRLGGPARRLRGVRLRLRGSRVREIAVTGRRYRTATGIRVGSSEVALQRAHAGDVLRGLRAALRGRVHRYRIGRATFEVRRGRVSRIVVRR